jgi:hypothetical protein
MDWECACGVTNSDPLSPCGGCGWSKDYSDRYKRGELPVLGEREDKERSIQILRGDMKKGFTFLFTALVVF